MNNVLPYGYKLILLLSILFFLGCSSAPEINREWPPTKKNMFGYHENVGKQEVKVKNFNVFFTFNDPISMKGYEVYGPFNRDGSSSGGAYYFTLPLANESDWKLMKGWEGSKSGSGTHISIYNSMKKSNNLNGYVSYNISISAYTSDSPYNRKRNVDVENWDSVQDILERRKEKKRKVNRDANAYTSYINYKFKTINKKTCEVYESDWNLTKYNKGKKSKTWKCYKFFRNKKGDLHYKSVAVKAIYQHISGTNSNKIKSSGYTFLNIKKRALKVVNSVRF